MVKKARKRNVDTTKLQKGLAVLVQKIIPILTDKQLDSIGCEVSFELQDRDLNQKGLKFEEKTERTKGDYDWLDEEPDFITTEDLGLYDDKTD